MTSISFRSFVYCTSQILSIVADVYALSSTGNRGPSFRSSSFFSHPIKLVQSYKPEGLPSASFFSQRSKEILQFLMAVSNLLWWYQIGSLQLIRSIILNCGCGYIHTEHGNENQCMLKHQKKEKKTKLYQRLGSAVKNWGSIPSMGCE